MSFSWDPSAGQSGGGGTNQVLSINGYQLSIVPGNTVTLPSGSGTTSTSMNLIVSTLQAQNNVLVGSKITMLSTGVVTACNVQISSATIGAINNSVMSNFSIATDNINANSATFGNEQVNGSLTVNGAFSASGNNFTTNGIITNANFFVPTIIQIPESSAAPYPISILSSNAYYPFSGLNPPINARAKAIFAGGIGEGIRGVEFVNTDIFQSGYQLISTNPITVRSTIAVLPNLSTQFLSVSNSIFFQSNNGVLVGSNDGNLYYNNQLVNAGNSVASQWSRFPALQGVDFGNQAIGGINGLYTNTGPASIQLNAAFINGPVGDVQIGNLQGNVITNFLYKQPKITLGGSEVNIAAGNMTYATGNKINMDAYAAFTGTPILPIPLNAPNSQINITAHGGYDVAIPNIGYVTGGAGVINLTAYNSALLGIPNAANPGYINLNASVVNVGNPTYTGIGNTAFVNLQANTVQIIGGADLNPNFPPNLGTIVRSKFGMILYNDRTIGYNSNRDSILYVARITGNSLFNPDYTVANYNLQIDSPGQAGVTISNATNIYGHTGYGNTGVNIYNLQSATGAYPDAINSNFSTLSSAILSVASNTVTFSTNAGIAINTLSTTSAVALSNWSQFPTKTPIYNNTALGVNISSAVTITGSLQNGNTGVTIYNLTNATGNYPSFINSTFAAQQTQINNLQLSTSGGLSSIFLWSAYPALSTIFNTNINGVKISNVYTVTGSLDYGNTGMALVNISSATGLYPNQLTSSFVGIQSNVSTNQSTMIGLTSSLQSQISSLSNATTSGANTWAAYPAQSTIYSPFPLSLTNTTSNAIIVSTSYLNIKDNYNYPKGVIVNSLGLKNNPGLVPDVYFNATAGTYQGAIYSGLDNNLTSLYVSSLLFAGQGRLQVSSSSLLINGLPFTSGSTYVPPSSLTVSTLTYNNGINEPITLSTNVNTAFTSFPLPMIASAGHGLDNAIVQSEFIASAVLGSSPANTYTTSYKSGGVLVSGPGNRQSQPIQYIIDSDSYPSMNLSRVSTINGVPWQPNANNMSTVANWSYYPVANSNITFGNKTAWIAGGTNALFTDSSNVNTIPVNAKAFVLYDPTNVGVIANLNLAVDGIPTMSKGSLGPNDFRVSTLYMVNDRITVSNSTIFVNGINQPQTWANYTATSSVNISSSQVFQKITSNGADERAVNIVDLSGGFPYMTIAGQNATTRYELDIYGRFGVGGAALLASSNGVRTDLKMLVSSVIINNGVPGSGLVITNNTTQNKTLLAESFISTLQTQTSSINYVSGDVLTASTGTLYFNGVQVNANNWSATPASQIVNFGGFGACNIDTITSDNFTNTGFPQTGYQISTNAARFNYQTQIYNYNAFSDFSALALQTYGTVIAQGNITTTGGFGFCSGQITPNQSYMQMTPTGTGVSLNRMYNTTVQQSGFCYDTYFNPLPTYPSQFLNQSSNATTLYPANSYTALNGCATFTATTDYAVVTIETFPLIGIAQTGLQVGFGVVGATNYKSNYMVPIIDSPNYTTYACQGKTTPGVTYAVKGWTSTNTVVQYYFATYKPVPS